MWEYGILCLFETINQIFQSNLIKKVKALLIPEKDLNDVYISCILASKTYFRIYILKIYSKKNHLHFIFLSLIKVFFSIIINIYWKYMWTLFLHENDRKKINFLNQNFIKIFYYHLKTYLFTKLISYLFNGVKNTFLVKLNAKNLRRYNTNMWKLC